MIPIERNLHHTTIAGPFRVFVRLNFLLCPDCSGAAFGFVSNISRRKREQMASPPSCRPQARNAPQKSSIRVENGHSLSCHISQLCTKPAKNKTRPRALSRLCEAIPWRRATWRGNDRRVIAADTLEDKDKNRHVQYVRGPWKQADVNKRNGRGLLNGRRVVYALPSQNAAM